MATLSDKNNRRNTTQITNSTAGNDLGANQQTTEERIEMRKR